MPNISKRHARIIIFIATALTAGYVAMFMSDPTLLQAGLIIVGFFLPVLLLVHHVRRNEQRKRTAFEEDQMHREIEQSQIEE